MTKPLILLAAALVIAGSAPAASAAAPKGAVVAFEALRAAVESGDTARITALVPLEHKVVFRAKAHPAAPAHRELDRAGLEARLRAGDGNALGLDKGLLLPVKKHLRRAKAGGWEATDPRCAEVRWRFTKVGKRWCLAEVVRTLLDC